MVSSSGSDNGCYGFFDIETLVEAPFVTVPSAGSIGEARVQLFPCGVTDDCLILFDREPIEYAADSDFMTDDQRHKAYARFSVGHTDPRGIFGAAGG